MAPEVRGTGRNQEASGGGARRTSVLAASSGGGHWVQLLRILPAFQGCSVVFLTVDAAAREELPGDRVHIVRDATRWDGLGVVQLALQVFRVLLRERPDVVVSTGAAPGFMAVIFGKLLGSTTIWLDSIANCEEISLSGHLARRFSDLRLTQWAHLASDRGFEYAGRVF